MVQSRDKLAPLRFHSGVPALDAAADVVVLVQNPVEAAVQKYAAVIVLHSARMIVAAVVAAAVVIIVKVPVVELLKEVVLVLVVLEAVLVIVLDHVLQYALGLVVHLVMYAVQPAAAVVGKHVQVIALDIVKIFVHGHVEKVDVMAHVMMTVQRTVQLLVLIYVKAQQKPLLAEVVDVLLTVQVDVQKDALLLVVVDVQMAVAILVLVAALAVVVLLAKKAVYLHARQIVLEPIIFNIKNSPSLTRGASFFISFDIHKRL